MKFVLIPHAILSESSSLPDPSPPSSLEISETDAVEAPTEDTINKLIDDNQLYKDPYVTAVITECYGRTPLHIAVTDKHEDVVNCFIDFQGRSLFWLFFCLFLAMSSVISSSDLHR